MQRGGLKPAAMQSEKFVMKVLAPLVVLVVFASVLQAAEGFGPYFRLEAGPSIEQDIRLKSIDGFATPDAKIKLDPGARFNLVGGYSFYDWFAVEAEAGMLYNSLNKLTGPAGESDIEDINLWQVPFLINVVFTLPLRSPIKPYIGVGGGELWSMAEGPDVRSDDDFALAYQGQAGVNYFINEQMDIGLGYKFLAAQDHHIGDFKTKETYNHSLLLQFTFKY